MWGGAKVSDKIGLLENIFGKCDNILVGGGMASTFYKAMGGEIGDSLVELDKLDLAKEILEKAEKKNTRIVLPEDSVVADAFNNEAKTQTVSSDEIPAGWMGLDIGPRAVEALSNIIKNSKTVMWNGPMGVVEMEKFAQGSVGMAKRRDTA